MVSTLSGLTMDEQAHAAEAATVEGIAVDKMEGIFLLWKRAEVKAVVMCKAFSLPDEVLAECFPQVTPVDVSLVLKHHPSAREVFQKWSIKLKQFDGPNAENRLLPLALLIQEQILRNSNAKDSDRLRIVEDLKDRVKGKPKQTIQTANLNLNADSSVEENSRRIGTINERLESLMEVRNKILRAKEALSD